MQPNQFTIEALSEEIDYLEQKSYDIKNKQLNLVKPPEKFSKDTKWRSFKLEFLNYLDSIKGQKGVPVRPNQRPQGVAEDDIVYSTVHQGPAYAEDNRTVFNILQGFMLGGPGEVFTRPFINSKNGRGAFMAVDEALNQGSYETSKVNQAWITIRGVQYTGN